MNAVGVSRPGHIARYLMNIRTAIISGFGVASDMPRYACVMTLSPPALLDMMPAEDDYLSVTARLK